MPPGDVTPESHSRDQFVPEPHQQLIHGRLKSLVGSGAADFYIDACRIMSIKPPLVATTHLVSHSLREVESALRDVLESLTGPVEKSKDAEENHLNEIRAILRALDIKDDDPVAEAWTALPGEAGLQKRAHRNNLEASRPLDAKFFELWRQMELILDAVLEKFEGKYTGVFRAISELTSKAQPGRGDADTLIEHIPNNYVARQRFFSSLTPSRVWLEMLRARDVFRLSPPAEVFPDGSRRFPPWSALVYLRNSAEKEPALIAEILAAVDSNGNAATQGSLLEIASVLPEEHRITLLEKEKEWMESPLPLFVGREGARLIGSFIEDDDLDSAFSLAEKYLEILPDPRTINPPEDTTASRFYSPSPRARVDDWQYAEFLKEEFSKMAGANPNKSLDFLCDRLSDFLKFANPNAEDEYQDSMYISRPAIEEHEQNHMRDGIEHSLLKTIRNLSEEVTRGNIEALRETIALFEIKRWAVFKRLALFLLSQQPALDINLTDSYLLDKENFENHEFKHEYALLLHSAYPLLEAGKKDVILGWIDNADEIKERIERNGIEDTDEQAIRYRKNWQRDKLSFIKEFLEGDWEDRYKALLAEVGEPDHPDFSSYSTSFVGPVSEANAHQISDMTDDALMGYLQTWEPTKDRAGFGPSKDGLGRELSQAIRTQPERFENIAERFIGLDPTYVRSYFLGFNDVDISNWQGIFALCEWVLEQPREIPGRTGHVMDQDPDWSWTRRTIASTLTKGVQSNSIPFDSRERLWGIIADLTEDPEPTPEEEEERGDMSEEDPYTLTINTTRGEAMDAVVQYALWIYRELKKTEAGSKQLEEGFKVMPEVQEVLERHLDVAVDPSAAVRAIYGRYLPWLHLLDRSWVQDNLQRILPPGNFGDRLYLAAWGGYILYLGTYNEMLSLLHDQYAEALNHFKPEGAGQREDRDTCLVEHIMQYYMQGRLPPTDPIFESFWDIAPPEMRGYALDYLGRILASRNNENEELAADAAERLQALWESRVEAAEASADKEPFKVEMEAFGWWYASGRFPEKWSSDQFIRALAIAGNKTQIDHLVADKLLELVESLPVETIQILRSIVMTEQPAWILLGNKEDIRTILSRALNSPIGGARDITEDLINRLAANGYPEFGDLLNLGVN